MVKVNRELLELLRSGEINAAEAGALAALDEALDLQILGGPTEIAGPDGAPSGGDRVVIQRGLAPYKKYEPEPRRLQALFTKKITGGRIGDGVELTAEQRGALGVASLLSNTQGLVAYAPFFESYPELARTRAGGELLARIVGLVITDDGRTPFNELGRTKGGKNV